MNELRQRIIDCIDSGMTVKQIEAETGAGTQNIYATAHRYGRRFGNGNIPKLTGKEKEIRELIAKGTPYLTLSKRYGVNSSTVRAFCKRIGAMLTAEQTAVNERTAKPQDEADVIRKVNESGKGVEYVSGYVNSQSRITVRCKACGHEYAQRYDVILFHDGKCGACPRCRAEHDAKVAEERRIRDAQAAKDRERREADRAKAKAKREQEAERKRKARIHQCPICGETTDRPKYCSDQCAKRAENKKRDVKRRIKIKTAMVDSDISLWSLYKRDGGRCHICGLQCNYEDYTVRDGTTITGDWYPSIDHVIPLSKGGLHAWSNVKLAHRRCNSYKSDKV